MKKIHILLLVVIIFLTQGIIPKQALAADRLDDNCNVSVTSSYSPNPVQNWKNEVKLTITVERNYAVGYYCSSTDEVVATFSVQGQGKIGDVKVSMPPNETGIGKRVVMSQSMQIRFGGYGPEAVIPVNVNALWSKKIGERYIAPVIKSVNPSVLQVKCNGLCDGGVVPTPTSPVLDPPINQPGGGIPPSIDLPEIKNPSGASNLSELITRLIRILLTLIVMASVIMIVISGFRMVAYGYSPGDLSSAKKGLVWAIIGLVIALMSFTIVSMVQRLL